VRGVKKQQHALSGSVFRRAKDDGRVFAESAAELLENESVVLKLAFERL
jgi:hypothetical protein